MNDQDNDLEQDLKNSEIIITKAKSSVVYAQNLYAALCSNLFQKNSVITLLKNQHWSCTWGHAGAIVAEIAGDKNTVDWYSNAIKEYSFRSIYDDHTEHSEFLEEGVISAEIARDLRSIGWRVYRGPR